MRVPAPTEPITQAGRATRTMLGFMREVATTQEMTRQDVAELSARLELLIAKLEALTVLPGDWDE